MKFLRHFSTRERIIFYITAAVIASAISDNLVVKRIVKIWAGLNEKITEANRELSRNYRLIGREKEILSEYEKYISYMKTKEEGREKASSILMEIENLAGKNRVVATDIKPLASKKIDFYEKYMFEVAAEGDIKSLARFIYDMQSSSNILLVEHLTITAKTTGGDSLRAVMRIAHASMPKGQD